MFKYFKLSLRDKYLLLGFAVSVITILWLSWEVADTHANRFICKAYGKTWYARADGICYFADSP